MIKRYPLNTVIAFPPHYNTSGNKKHHPHSKQHHHISPVSYHIFINCHTEDPSEISATGFHALSSGQHLSTICLIFCTISPPKKLSNIVINVKKFSLCVPELFPILPAIMPKDTPIIPPAIQRSKIFPLSSPSGIRRIPFR